jgi:hypothetical protein
MTEAIDKFDLLEKDENGKPLPFDPTNINIPLSHEPYLPADGGDNFAYVMFVRDGEIISEPYIPLHGDDAVTYDKSKNKWLIKVDGHECYDDAIHVNSEGTEIDTANYVVG